MRSVARKQLPSFLEQSWELLTIIPRKSLKKLNKSSGEDNDASLFVKWSVSQWLSNPPTSLNCVISSSKVGSNMPSNDYKTTKQQIKQIKAPSIVLSERIIFGHRIIQL